MKHPFNWAAASGFALLVAACYWPGLGGGFAFDDYHNIVDNPALQPPALTLQSLWEAATSNASGPLKRPLAALSFLVNFKLFGAGAFAFKAVNLGLHLLNGVLVFALLNLLLPQVLRDGDTARRAALWTTALWLLHPLQVSTVLYVVQRMTSLAAGFTLLALWAYLRLRLADIQGLPLNRLRHWVGFVLAAIAGLACKETALLIPVYIGVIELCALRFERAPGLRRLMGAGVVLGGLGLTAMVLGSDVLERWFAARPFSAGERLLTETRVLWFYLGEILLPHFGRMALFHHFAPLSTDLLHPWTTLLACAAWLLVLITAWLARRRMPVLGLAVGGFLGGHLLESTVVPLDLVYEHRNYLPSLGPLLGVGTTLAHIGRHQPGHARLVGLGMLLVLAAMTATRAWQWRDPYTHALLEARHHPQSWRPHYELGRLELMLYRETREPSLLKSARNHLRKAAAVGDDDFMPLIALVNSYPLTGRDPPRALQAALGSDLATGNLSTQRLFAVYLISRCQQPDGGCPVRPDLVLGVVEALLRHPDLTPARRAVVLRQLATYYALALADYPAAARVTDEVLRLTPDDHQQRLAYVHLLLAQQRYPAARVALDTLQTSQPWWRAWVDPEFVRLLKKAQRQLDDMAPAQ